MKYLQDQYYVGVKGHRYIFHPTENTISRLINPTKSLATQYHIQNDTQFRKNQKVIKNDKDELIVKNYPRNKQPTQQQPNLKHQIFLPANEIIGWNLIKVIIVKIVNILSISKNIRWMRKYLEKNTMFLLY